jgi:hypothetical protein
MSARAEVALSGAHENMRRRNHGVGCTYFGSLSEQCKFLLVDGYTPGPLSTSWASLRPEQKPPRRPPQRPPEQKPPQRPPEQKPPRLRTSPKPAHFRTIWKIFHAISPSIGDGASHPASGASRTSSRRACKRRKSAASRHGAQTTDLAKSPPVYRGPLLQPPSRLLVAPWPPQRPPASTYGECSAVAAVVARQLRQPLRQRLVLRAAGWAQGAPRRSLHAQLRRLRLALHAAKAPLQGRRRR